MLAIIGVIVFFILVIIGGLYEEAPVLFYILFGLIFSIVAVWLLRVLWSIIKSF